MDWPKHTLVEVMWEDAYEQDDWKDMGSPEEPYILTTVGYLIREDDNAVVIAQSINIYNRRNNTLCVPRGLIVGIKRLSRRGNYERKRKT